ncbi:MAG: hypothetical protein KBA46_03995, partial [Candidatus Omnitrophica bacterium]|nr:hypothetical protein [Candidatus Omnitrophota bacterium]
RLDIRSGGGNFLHGCSSPIEFSMRTNAINTDLRVRFNSDTFVGDTRTYVCPAGQTSCRGSTETRLYFNDYDQNDRSMELNGLVLTDWPELSRARIDIQNPLFLLPRPPEHDHDFTEEQDLCFRQFPNDTVALERCLAHTVRIPALNEFNSRRVKKMMQGFTRTSGWWFGFGIGIAEAVHVGFGMEFIPPFYIHQYKEMTYEVDPCYYPGTAIEDQCPGGRLIGE